MQLEKKYLKLIQFILEKYPYNFFVFGSRVKNKARRFSDLDVCYKEYIPDNIIIQLEEKFEESDLPFKVDLLDWHHCTKDFQTHIEPDLIPIQLLDKKNDLS
jgi:predicted nucleotidyltransferase